jgi:hypothetical protein
MLAHDLSPVIHYASGGKIVSNPQRVGKRRLPRWAKITLIVVGILAVLLLGPRLYIEWRLHSRIAEIRAAGYPLTQEDPDAYYPTPPPGEDAAEVLKQAHAKIHGDDFPSPWGIIYGSLPPTASVPQEAQQLLTDNQEALRLLHKAATMPACRLTEELTSSLPQHGYQSAVDRCVDLLLFEAAVSLKERNAAATTAALVAALRILRTLRCAPPMDDRMMQSEIGWWSVLDMLAFPVNTHILGDEQLALLSRELAREDSIEPFIRRLAYQRCEVWLGLSEPPDPQIGSAFLRLPYCPLISIPHRLYGASGWRTLHLFRALDLTQRWIELFLMPPYRREKPGRDLYTSTANASIVVVPEADLLPWAVMSSLTYSFTETGLGHDYAEPTSDQAQVRAILAGLAIERYRLATGHIPDSLDQLVPRFLDAVPVYPWDGKPLHYEKTEDSYSVYAEDRYLGQTFSGTGPSIWIFQGTLPKTRPQDAPSISGSADEQ